MPDSFQSDKNSLDFEITRVHRLLEIARRFATNGKKNDKFNNWKRYERSGRNRPNDRDSCC